MCILGELSKKPTHGFAAQVIGEGGGRRLCRCRHGIGATIDVARNDDISVWNTCNGQFLFTPEGNVIVINSVDLGDVASECHSVIGKIHDEAHLVDGLRLRIRHRHRPIAQQRLDHRFGSLRMRPSEQDQRRQRCTQ
jgi:hypothetical protein